MLTLFYHLFKNDILNLSRNFEQDLLILLKKYLIMQTASFTGFIRILFYILAFYYIFKFLAKLLLPLIVKKVVKKAENYQQQQEKAQDPSKEAIQR
jgi:hypothetical protein